MVQTIDECPLSRRRADQVVASPELDDRGPLSPIGDHRRCRPKSQKLMPAIRDLEGSACRQKRDPPERCVCDAVCLERGVIGDNIVRGEPRGHQKRIGGLLRERSDPRSVDTAADPLRVPPPVSLKKAIEHGGARRPGGQRQLEFRRREDGVALEKPSRTGVDDCFFHLENLFLIDLGSQCGKAHSCANHD